VSCPFEKRLQHPCVPQPEPCHDADHIRWHKTSHKDAATALALIKALKALTTRPQRRDGMAHSRPPSRFRLPVHQRTTGNIDKGWWPLRAPASFVCFRGVKCGLFQPLRNKTTRHGNATLTVRAIDMVASASGNLPGLPMTGARLCPRFIRNKQCNAILDRNPLPVKAYGLS
jgi:hypothetical protein